MAAMQKADVRPEDVHMNIAIAKYLNSGGTFERLRALVDAAERMSGKGQVSSAASGHIRGAQPRQPVEGEDVECILPQGRVASASSLSPHRDGRGHSSHADRGRPTEAAPVREPSYAQRRASREVGKVIALTILDTHRIRDGRAIGDVRYGEIETLRTANAMEASIFRQIQKRIGYAEQDAKLRDLITAEELNAMKQKAAEVADAQ